ncbi:sensor domain-containing diguanylate cyclase [Paucibacter aquatile]|uniref:diguanylate cyclase n=1 Tax=Kinneretia aquatilis TaxID=2070761 RepID=A0A2N8KST6_9BURK|nr:GGDEF domain-containing protein [Paucibacter aquatile]PND36528.1 sensor domain-containing diguanylate cyclase [Paucibacter aquatile]WIV95882.1 GGDEF domain-containing protein [Paucibacter aquatile]
MNNPAAPDHAVPPAQGSLAHWLAGHGAVASDMGATLLSLIEPLNLLAAIKSLATGRYVFASPGLDRLFERSESSVVGSVDNDLMRAEEVVAMRRVEQAVMAQRSVTVSEHRLELGGRRREFTVTRAALGTEFVLSVWQERTEERHRESHLQRALQQLEQQQKALEQIRRELQQGSGRDEVSGLYLQAQFDDALLREIDLSTREHREFALVIIALDPAPAAIQALGEEANQRLLEGMGRMLRANTRAMDAACRVGHSRFAVLLSGVGLATAHARMEQLRRQCMAQIIVLNGQDMGLSLSMGVCSFPHTASKQDELWNASEAAVHEAQRRGGNQVVLASIPFGA